MQHVARITGIPTQIKVPTLNRSKDPFRLGRQAVPVNIRMESKALQVRAMTFRIKIRLDIGINRIEIFSLTPGIGK